MLSSLAVLTFRAPLPTTGTWVLKTRDSPRSDKRFLCLVTEDDVEAAVEKAEKLWAQAFEARKRAEKLSDEAETFAQQARCRSGDALLLIRLLGVPTSRSQPLVWHCG